MRMTSALPPVAAATLASVLACSDRAYDPSLLARRDSADVEIVEALRPLWGNSTRWRIDPEPLVDLAESGSGESHLFHQVRGMTRLSDGTLAVADGGSDEIRLYTATGTFRTSAGGRGDGPGEFSRLIGLTRGRGDTLIALDHSDRIALFAPDLTFVEYLALPHFSLAVHPLDDGDLIVESEMMSLEILEGGGLVRVPTILWRVDPAEAGVDSIGETAGEEQHVVVSGPRQGQTGTLFGRRSHVATHSGHVYHGHAVSFEVEVLTSTGELVRILRVPTFPLSLGPEAIRAERSALLGDDAPPWWQATVAEIPAPSTRPAYDGLFTDPSGAVWLRPFRGRSEQEGPETWQVLADDGRWLGGVEFPEDFEVMQIETDVVLGVWRDELDVEHPRVLRLKRDG